MELQLNNEINQTENQKTKTYEPNFSHNIRRQHCLCIDGVRR